MLGIPLSVGCATTVRGVTAGGGTGAGAGMVERQPSPTGAPDTTKPAVAQTGPATLSPRPDGPERALPDPKANGASVTATWPRLPWVNPARCLSPCNYEPATLLRVGNRADSDAKGRHRISAEIQDALRALLSAAHAAGHEIRIESAYRSYDDQARLFSTMKEIGRAARPGHSEHQLGTAVDLRLPTGAAIDWLAEHAAEFGFALSYPAARQRITGYRPEPWHVRYVGRELAVEVARDGGSLEEFFRAHAGVGESGGCGECPHAASQAACGAVDSAGTCSGTVLSWCYDGVLATVDCATSGQTCGVSQTENVHDCLPKSAPAAGAAGDRSSAPADGVTK